METQAVKANLICNAFVSQTLHDMFKSKNESEASYNLVGLFLVFFKTLC